MISEPCEAYIPYWKLEDRKKYESVSVSPNHNWGSWSTLKEEFCQSKDSFQVNLQERECQICGLLQQRRVRI